MARAAARKIGSFGAIDLHIIAWSFCVAGALDARLFGAIAGVLPSYLDDLSMEGRAQLYQVYLYLSRELPDSLLVPVLGEHSQQLKEAFVSQDVEPSQTQNEVSRVLTSLGWSHEEEHRTEEGFESGHG